MPPARPRRPPDAKPGREIPNVKIAKIAAVTTTTAALALGLAACSSGDDSADSTPSAAASDGGNGPQFAGQSLRVWRLGAPTENDDKFMNDLNAKFKEQTRRRQTRVDPLA